MPRDLDDNETERIQNDYWRNYLAKREFLANALSEIERLPDTIYVDDDGIDVPAKKGENVLTYVLARDFTSSIKAKLKGWSIDTASFLSIMVEEPKKPMAEDRHKQVHAAVARLLTALGVDWEHDANYKETASRVATYLLEKFPDADAREVKRGMLARKVFPSEYDGVIAQTGISVWSLCPHHLIPVEYKVSMGYLPQDHVIGLSKLARLAELELGVAGTQEDLTRSLTDRLIVMLHTTDVAVVVKGRHHCMIARGVKQQASLTTTSEMRGKFRDNHSNIRAEFFELVHNGGSK